MPKIPVDECPAGPEMDAAVAEALGQCGHYLKPENGSGQYKCVKCEQRFAGLAYKEGYSVKSYSTDIAAAWELVDWMHRRISEAESGNESTLSFNTKLYQRLQLFAWSNGEEWLASFDRRNIAGFSNGFVSIADSVQLAICRAFLKANGVTHIEAE